MEIADIMPDNGEFHLPHFQKQEVYPVYGLQLSWRYPREKFSSLLYLLSIWKEHCSHIKCRKSPHFQNSAHCRRMRVDIRTVVKENMLSTEFFRQQELHQEFIAAERQSYRVKSELDKGHTSKYLTIAVDSVDQSKVANSHECATRIRLRMNLIGVIEHAPIHHLRM